MATVSGDFITLDEQWGAHNYHPLPVVIAEAEGAWVTDVDGQRYLDFLSGYSALNFGHRHPALLQAAHDQLDRLTLTSRAFHNDQFGHFCQELAELTGTEMVLTMNTGAEAVESAIKVARKVGVRGQGRRVRLRRDHRGVRQLPRSHHHHRLVLRRPGRPRQLRALHPGLHHRPLRRRRGGPGGHRAEHRGRADGADPGRGRGHRPAGRLLGRRPRRLRRERRT